MGASRTQRRPRDSHHCPPETDTWGQNNAEKPQKQPSENNQASALYDPTSTCANVRGKNDQPAPGNDSCLTLKITVGEKAATFNKGVCVHRVRLWTKGSHSCQSQCGRSTSSSGTPTAR